MRNGNKDVAILSIERLLEMDRAAYAANIYKHLADERQRLLDEARAEVERLRAENEELQRALHEANNSVEWWRSSYNRAVKKYAEAVVDEDHEQG